LQQKVNHHLIPPPYITINDTVGVAAPARKITRDELQPALDLLKSWGLKVVLASNIFETHHQYAGTDERRIKGFQELLDNDSVKAIICARGGYGCMRIIDMIDFTKFKTHPKWITGYSDLTVFHSHIQTNFGIETLHATMAINVSTNTTNALESFRKALFGEKISYRIASHQFNRKGTAKGIITGGNLSILYALSGSSSDIDTSGKLLFIEDLEEYLYHIDRMMMQLKRSGKLSNLAGLIVGGMNNMNDNTVPFGKTAYEIIAEAVSEYSYPVCFNFPTGHIDDNNALILGRSIILSVEADSACLSF
jgi:muramoyltetrapeptide carboxypeptidase